MNVIGNIRIFWIYVLKLQSDVLKSVLRKRLFRLPDVRLRNFFMPRFTATLRKSLHQSQDVPRRIKVRLRIQETILTPTWLSTKTRQRESNSSDKPVLCLICRLENVFEHFRIVPIKLNWEYLFRDRLDQVQLNIICL